MCVRVSNRKDINGHLCKMNANHGDHNLCTYNSQLHVCDMYMQSIMISYIQQCQHVEILSIQLKKIIT